MNQNVDNEVGMEILVAFMKKLKINSKRDYNKMRVMKGYGPHRMLRMLINKRVRNKDEKVNCQEEADIVAQSK